MNYQIYIGNVRNPTHKGIIFPVDRKTPLGNPLRIGTRADGTREQVVEFYAQNFKTFLEDKQEAREYLIRIHEAWKKNHITLLCHCSPLLCHARVIRYYLWFVGNSPSSKLPFQT